MGLKPSISIRFGDRFRALRKNDGFTQDSIAEALGMSSRAISTWETGERLPPVEMVAWLAEEWGVSVDYLLGRTDYPVFEMRNASGDILFSGSGGTKRETHEELGQIAFQNGIGKSADLPPSASKIGKEPDLTDEEKRKLRELLAKNEQNESLGKNVAG